MKLAQNVLEELWFGEDDATASDEAASKSLSAKLAELEGVRPFPEVVERVFDRLANPNYDVVAIERLISEDPALAARVLRVANSAGFGPRAACATIRDAVIRLGARQLRELAIALATMEMFSGMTGVAAQVRDHSAVAGGLVRVLAAHTGAATDGAFLAGLLHDLGKLLLMQSNERDYHTLDPLQAAPDQVHMHERALYGYDHAVLGAHILRGWKFPDPIPQVVAWHHQPVRAYEAGDPIAPLVALVRVSDAIQPLLAAGAADPATLDALAALPDSEQLRLNSKKLATLWPDLEEARRDALSYFAH